MTIIISRTLKLFGHIKRPQLGVTNFCFKGLVEGKRSRGRQPKQWRDKNDILEKIKKGQTQQLTNHLNTIDTTGNIQFIVEEEQDRTIHSLDTTIQHRQDGTIKFTVYRKPTHTDQYLLWTSEHPTELLNTQTNKERKNTSQHCHHTRTQ